MNSIPEGEMREEALRRIETLDYCTNRGTNSSLMRSHCQTAL